MSEPTQSPQQAEAPASPLASAQGLRSQGTTPPVAQPAPATAPQGAALPVTQLIADAAEGTTASQWQALPGWGPRPLPTATASLVGGGLLVLAGLLSVISTAVLYGNRFIPALFDTTGPTSTPVINVVLVWESFFGGLVVAIVALVAVRRHFVAVAVVALVVQGIFSAYIIWSGFRSGLTALPQLTWASLVYTLAFCLMLALALSRRATKVLKIITMAVFAVLLARLIIFTHYGVAGASQTLAVIWIGFAGYLLDKVGWLVLVASTKTRFD